MKKPSHKLTEKQLTILSAGVGLVVFLGICGVIFWAVSTAGTLHAEIRQMDVTCAELERKERDLPRLEREIASLQVEVERGVQILPNKREIADLIKNIGAIRAQTNENDVSIKITKFQPDEGKKLRGMKEAENTAAEQRFTPQPYIVEARGNYFHLGRFINLLENHIRFIKVESYEMKNPGKDTWECPEKDITVKIVTYTYNPGQGETVERSESPKIDWKEVIEGSFLFERRNRRDPFKIPLKNYTGGEGPDQRPLLTEKEQKALVTKSARLYKELEYLIRTNQVDKALKIYLDIEEIYGQRFTVPEYFKRIQKTYLDAKDLTKDIQDQAAREAVQRADAMLKKMQKAFNNGDYKRLKAISDQIKPLLRVNSESPEITDRLAECGRKVDELIRRAEIRIEFFKADIRITGVFGGVRKSTIIFNGNKHGEAGMKVEIDGVKFLVKKVNPAKASAIVIYKNEEIELTLGEERSRIWRLKSEEKKEAETDTDADTGKEKEPVESEHDGGMPPPQQG